MRKKNGICVPKDQKWEEIENFQEFLTSFSNINTRNFQRKFILYTCLYNSYCSSI